MADQAGMVNTGFAGICRGNRPYPRSRNQATASRSGAEIVIRIRPSRWSKYLSVAVLAPRKRCAEASYGCWQSPRKSIARGSARDGYRRSAFVPVKRRSEASETRIKDRGAARVAEVLHETRRWRSGAHALKIARADIELTAAAFAESDAGHNQSGPKSS